MKNNLGLKILYGIYVILALLSIGLGYLVVGTTINLLVAGDVCFRTKSLIHFPPPQDFSFSCIGTTTIYYPEFFIPVVLAILLIVILNMRKIRKMMLAKEEEVGRKFIWFNVLVGIILFILMFVIYINFFNSMYV